MALLARRITWMLYQALTGVTAPILHNHRTRRFKRAKTRFEAFVEKALREAKLRTGGWTCKRHETAVTITYVIYWHRITRHFAGLLSFACNPSSAQGWLTAQPDADRYQINRAGT